MENATQVHLEPVYVGFWARVRASFLDSLLYVLVVYPVLIMVYGFSYLTTEEFLDGPIDILVTWVLPGILVIAFWFYKSATPGKMAISAKIVDARTLGTPSDAQFIGRYFAYLVSFLPLCLGFLWVAFDRRKQGWHDKLAGTVVIRR